MAHLGCCFVGVDDALSHRRHWHRFEEARRRFGKRLVAEAAKGSELVAHFREQQDATKGFRRLVSMVAEHFREGQCSKCRATAFVRPCGFCDALLCRRCQWSSPVRVGEADLVSECSCPECASCVNWAVRRLHFVDSLEKASFSDLCTEYARAVECVRLLQSRVTACFVLLSDLDSRGAVISFYDWVTAQRAVADATKEMRLLANHGLWLRDELARVGPESPMRPLLASLGHALSLANANLSSQFKTQQEWLGELKERFVESSPEDSSSRVEVESVESFLSRPSLRQPVSSEPGESHDEESNGWSVRKRRPLASAARMRSSIKSPSLETGRQRWLASPSSATARTSNSSPPSSPPLSAYMEPRSRAASLANTPIGTPPRLFARHILSFSSREGSGYNSAAGESDYDNDSDELATSADDSAAAEVSLSFRRIWQPDKQLHSPFRDAVSPMMEQGVRPISPGRVLVEGLSKSLK